MVSSQLTLLFVIVLGTCVDCSPTAGQSQELTDREMEMKQLFMDRAEMMEATNRDMHNWWAEYDILMANYRAMFADNICHNPDMLNTSLLIIEAKIEKVHLTLTNNPVTRQINYKCLPKIRLGGVGP